MAKSKIGNKLSQNKVLLVLGIILIICFVLIVVALFKYFYSGNNSSKYGDRLEDIDKHPIHENLQSEIEGLYTKEEVSKVNVKNSGRIIYLTIDLASVFSKVDAKNLALKSLDKFTDDEKGYYDIQFIVTCSTETGSDTEGSSTIKLFPVEGYKNATSAIVVWTNN